MGETEGSNSGMELARLAIAAAEERAKSCTAAIYGWSKNQATRREFVGTGTLIEHGGRLLILTCAHVADDFLGSHDGDIILGEGASLASIPQREARLWQQNDEDDVALIQIERLPQPGLVPRPVADFRPEPDFRKMDASRRGFVLVGFPAEMVEVMEKEGRRRVRSLTYATVDHPTKEHTEHRLYLKYRSDDEWSERLPHPRGLSGAAVIAWDVAKKDELWRYGQIVAIQSAAESKGQSYLQANTLRCLREWLSI